MITEVPVSVVIPVFRAAATIERAVGSVVSAARAAECILVDDGSDEATRRAMARLAERYPQRLRLVRHRDGGNHGPGASRNLGLAAACQPLVAFLDADDEFLAGGLDAAVKTLTRHPRLAGTYAPVMVQWHSGGPRQGGLPACIRFAGAGAGRGLLRRLVGGRHGGWCTLGVVLRRERLGGGLVFDAGVRQGEDTALWWRLAATVCLAPATLRPVAIYHRGAENTAPDGGRLAQAHMVAMALRTRAWAQRQTLRGRRDLDFGCFAHALGRTPGTSRFQWMVHVALTLLAHPWLVGPDLWLRKIAQRIAAS